ncbi:MAG: hypothetical protein WAN65_12350, partial [Candidatus Sulfotelmatobacter sp.]
MDSSIQELKTLRNRLSVLDPTDRNIVEAWIAEAKPLIRAYWPDHLSDFREASATPQWLDLPYVIGDDHQNELTARQEQAANIELARQAGARLLAFIDGLLRVAKNVQVQNTSNGISSQSSDSRKVFVVYGRNIAARDAMFAFLRALDLDPLEWSAIVHETGKASPFT